MLRSLAARGARERVRRGALLQNGTLARAAPHFLRRAPPDVQYDGGYSQILNCPEIDFEMSHVFLSDCRENQTAIDVLASQLSDAGVIVWLDRNDLRPGERWQGAIRDAIRGGAFFVACFSHEYSLKARSYMNEELTIAIEEIRMRGDRLWFIPVLLSACRVPSLRISASETLQDLQFVSLFDNWQAGVKRVLDVVRPIPRAAQLLHQGLKSGEPGLRKGAAADLGRIDTKFSFSILRDALKDPDMGVRLAAAKSLGQQGHFQAVPPLIDELKRYDTDSNTDARCSIEIIEALGEIGGSLAVSAIINMVTDDRLAEALPGEFRKLVDRFAEETLVRMGPSAVPDLIKALSDKRPPICQAAARVLGKIRDPSALPALALALDSPAYHFVTRALDDFGNIDATPGLIEVLTNENPEHDDARESAARFLGEFGDYTVAEALAKVVLDERWRGERFWYEAGKAICKIHAPESIPVLMYILANGPQEPEAAIALGLLKVNDAVPVILKTMESWLKEPFSMPLALHDLCLALGQIGDQGSVPPLIALLDHPEPLVRKGAAEALGLVGDERALPGLSRLADDTEWHTQHLMDRWCVGITAKEALRKIRAPSL